MPRIAYQPKTFSPATAAIIERANVIIGEYAAQGFDLTLRQLYYQFVARGYIANRDTEYKRLGSIVNDARLAGEIDWDAIVDRTRHLRSIATWETPAELIGAAARQYRNDRWRTQPLRVEVWIEKDALVGVIQGICDEYGVPYFSCRGYTSQSEMWSAARRLLGIIEGGQRVLVLHLGDHDPSGMDMTRDIRERLLDFIVKDWHRGHRADVTGTDGRITVGDVMRAINRSLGLDDELRTVEGRVVWDAFQVRRIALNWEQIEQYAPPPNPAKVTDSRSTNYIAEFGSESWELDALDPTTLAALIRDEVDAELDAEAWEATSEAEQRGALLLRRARDRWAELEPLLEQS